MRAVHRLRTGPAVPGVVLRVALGVVVSASGLLLTDVMLWQVLGVLSGVIAAIAPPLRTAYLGVVLVILGLLAHEPSLWRASIAALVVHGIHVLASTGLVVPLRARVTLRALRPAGIRFAAVQAIAQGAVLVAIGLPAGPGIAWFAPLGAVAVATVAVVLLVASRPRRN